MPTSEIRTHASTTIPLSRTRSSTSIKLVPPGALSTAICLGSFVMQVGTAKVAQTLVCVAFNHGSSGRHTDRALCNQPPTVHSSSSLCFCLTGGSSASFNDHLLFSFWG